MEFPFRGIPELFANVQPYGTVIVAGQYLHDRTVSNKVVCMKCGHEDANTALVEKNGACRVYCVACKYLYDIQALLRDPSMSCQMKQYAQQELRKLESVLHTSAVDAARRRVEDEKDEELTMQIETVH